MSAELKPCPWCGSSAVIVTDFDGFYAECGGAFQVCLVQPTTDKAESRNEAARMWNRRAPQWQPIETAPKDGTEVDLWHPKLGRITGCYWDSYMERWTILCESEGPTHFMMPPAAPEVKP